MIILCVSIQKGQERKVAAEFSVIPLVWNNSVLHFQCYVAKVVHKAQLSE